jgi:pimeloyl-ACP methyl ester carboxylesterase
MSTYESDGAKLKFTDSGTGAPVVFLHPTPLNGSYWEPLTEKLSGVRAIIPDLRGHGGSELGTGLPVGGFAAVPDAPVLTMAQLGTDILRLMDYRKLESAVFVGCSIGGYLLLELWRRAPERMRGLGFVCSKPQADAEANLARRVATIEQARRGELEAIFDGMGQTLTGATTRRENPRIAAELRAKMRLTAEGLVAVQAGLAKRPDSAPTVATITAPVLAIAGGEDGGVTVAEMEAFEAAPGGCEFHVLADAGHLAAFEQPESVVAILAPWLGQFES